MTYQRKYIPPHIKTIPANAERKFAGEIFDVYQWPQEMFDGSIATFEMLDRTDTVTTIAIKDNKIVLTYQKQPCKDWFYAYPGGRIDLTDDDELSGAKRELLEETGMEFANWKLIDAAQPYGKIDWIVYTFLATDFLRQSEQHLDGGEIIEIKEFSFADFKKLLDQPDTDALRFDFRKIEKLQSLDELKNLPSLYNY